MKLAHDQRNIDACMKYFEMHLSRRRLVNSKQRKGYMMVYLVDYKVDLFH